MGLKCVCFSIKKNTWPITLKYVRTHFFLKCDASNILFSLIRTVDVTDRRGFSFCEKYFLFKTKHLSLIKDSIFFTLKKKKTSYKLTKKRLRDKVRVKELCSFYRRSSGRSCVRQEKKKKKNGAPD